MDPIIRWAGSKRQLLHKLRPFWPRSTRYIEPFCGSACLFFDLEPEKAILGDLNTELISTYRALRSSPSLVFECLNRLPDGEEAYYKIRGIDPESLSEPEMAARFIYINKYCFNGIYRTNRSGKFNVPYGHPKSKAKFDFERLTKAARLLKNATLLNADFEKTIGRAEKGDFVYLDPPYAVADRRIFSEYQSDAFSIKDLERLSKCLALLDQKEVSFVVSYADSREAREILIPWNPKRVRAKRHIAGFASDRRSAYEVIATNITNYSNGN